MNVLLHVHAVDIPVWSLASRTHKIAYLFY